MKKLILLLLVAGLAWHGYARHEARLAARAAAAETSRAELAATGAIDTPAPAAAAAPPSEAALEPSSSSSPAPIPLSRPEAAARFSCDGRTHCSQMHSCAEATWFLQHCPGTEMDGDNDGVPCERQWCTLLPKL